MANELDSLIFLIIVLFYSVYFELLDLLWMLSTFLILIDIIINIRFQPITLWSSSAIRYFVGAD